MRLLLCLAFLFLFVGCTMKPDDTKGNKPDDTKGKDPFIDLTHELFVKCYDENEAEFNRAMKGKKVRISCYRTQISDFDNAAYIRLSDIGKKPSYGGWCGTDELNDYQTVLEGNFVQMGEYQEIELKNKKIIKLDKKKKSFYPADE
jgi:type IV pilus biogenesis protein CpaD/CtpE